MKLLRVLESDHYCSRLSLTEVLGYSRRQLGRWWENYRQGGLEALLEIGQSGVKKERITEEALEALEACRWLSAWMTRILVSRRISPKRRILNTFVLRDRLVEDYKFYGRSPLYKKDAHIEEQVIYERRIVLAWRLLHDKEVPIAEVYGAMGILRSMFYRPLPRNFSHTL